MKDFVVRTLHLEHREGDQVPPHRHHGSDEAFVVLRGKLEVLLDKERKLLHAGEHITIPAGVVHTYRTVDDEGVTVAAVRTPEVEGLFAELPEARTAEEADALWLRYNSEVVRQIHGF